LHALSAHLSPTPAVKWSNGVGPLAGIPARALALTYSDAALFGVLLQGGKAGEHAKKAVEAIKAAAGGISKDEAQRAAAKARFALLSTLETPLGVPADLVERAGAVDGAAISKVRNLRCCGVLSY